ncbi:MAG: fasciclin domain-containing protein [Chryseolinea sp.]
MKITKFNALLLTATVAFSLNLAVAQKTVTVGGAEMYPTKNIVENAMNSKDHTTLVAAVKAAGLVETLEGKGPFTVFAPTNDAFNALPAGTVETLLKEENKATLGKVLTYHVVAGKLDSKEIMKKIKDGNGKAEFTTVAGGKIWASMVGGSLMIWDEKNASAKVLIKDVYQSNGVIHSIDKVIMAK